VDEASRQGVERQLRPRPPIALGPVAADAGATAMMDVSDGLALDAGRMADASDVTIGFDGAAIDALAFGGRRSRALAGGEDHGLLAAFPADLPLPDGFRRIGTVVARGEHGVLLDGTPIPPSGWDPYRDWDGVTTG
jgi:thiamine-monophosphate kinase